MSDPSGAGQPSSSRSVSEQDLLRWAESLAGIARTGLGFTESLYERERYEEILHVAGDIRARADGGGEPTELAAEWMRIVGSGIGGYVTPKIAVGAVVGNDDGELLLIQRADSGVWLYPTGWADVGYSAAEVAEKEVFEETGIECEVVRPFAILDGLQLGFSRVPLYSIVFQCRAVGGELSHHPQECLDAGWFSRDGLPSPVASQDRWVDLAFAALAGEPYETSFDAARPQVWLA